MRETDPLAYATPYHAPVLCRHVITSLVTSRGGVYVDATLGGGGHSHALLDALTPAGHVFGIDQDDDALRTAATRLASFRESGRFRALKGNFAEMAELLDEAGIGAVDGVLMDLGVSSYQIDTAERGFSIRADGPLDMRMNADAGLTAHDIVNGWSEGDLRQILYDFGEEKRGRKLAHAIVQARPLETTHELAALVRQQVPTREEAKTVTRVFQALRIAVNAELTVLEQALVQATTLLKEGGRLAVISYHSLEDRRVKRFFRSGDGSGEPERDLYGNVLSPLTPLTRKAIIADANEIERNPRARSARLRVAERTAHPLPAQ
ncbi:MAG: 16S rRNA (cytosine(1402)-N(4))-methyltransferase RsmH [Bacteroidota bacterium]